MLTTASGYDIIIKAKQSITVNQPQTKKLIYECSYVLAEHSLTPGVKDDIATNCSGYCFAQNIVWLWPLVSKENGKAVLY